MEQILRGRYTAKTEGSFVVFLIGMRINNFLAVRKWWPVAQAMGPMLASLEAEPAKGYLGGRMLLGWRGSTMVQYWRSFEDLERFARDPDDAHHPAWKQFYKLVGQDDSVGVWHETYQVQPGQSEVMYVNMPRFGLAAATGLVPATGRRNTARGRMREEEVLSAVE